MSYFFWLGIDAEQYETIPFASFDYAIDPELTEDDGWITQWPKL